MLDELRALAIFARVAEEGSIRGAARALSLSPSVVSHHVKALEELDKRLEPVATAVEVRVRLKKGVELLRVYGSRRLNEVEAANFSIGACGNWKLAAKSSTPSGRGWRDKRVAKQRHRFAAPVDPVAHPESIDRRAAHCWLLLADTVVTMSVII